MRVGGAVAFLQCRDGGFELGLDGRAFATRDAAPQLGPQFLDVLVKRDHRPLLLFEGGAGAPPRSGRGQDACAAKRGAGGPVLPPVPRNWRPPAPSLPPAKLGPPPPPSPPPPPPRQRAPCARQNWGHRASLARPDRRGTMGDLRESVGGSGVCRARENPARIAPGGRCCRRRSVAVGPAAARPDEAEGLAAFVIEEVGVDRRGEARIVELDREVIAALAGALRPGGADLGAADKDPVARRVVAGPAGLRDDADAFGLDAESDDLALQFVAGLLEGTDGCHVVSPWR